MAVGIIGYSGSVGKNVTEYLLEKGFDVIGAGRHIHEPPHSGGTFRGAVVDINNKDQLESMICQCELVINCAAPAYKYAPIAAEAAGRAGCTYLDLTDSIIGKELPESGTYIASCGYVPGLSAIFPDLIIKENFDQAESVIIYQGGTGMCSDRAMLDVILTSESSGFIDSVFSGGKAVKAVTDPKRRYSLPFLGESAVLKPYLTYEMLRFAQLRGLPAVRWYNAYTGMPQLAFFLRLITALSKNDQEKAFSLMENERMKRAEGGPDSLYALMSGDITGFSGGRRKCMRFTHKVSDANISCGIAAAYIAEKVLSAGHIRPGVHLGFEFADEGILRELEKKKDANDIFTVEEIDEDLSLEKAVLA
ncbi:MAG TPA: hypothetical protein DCZ62_04700 [Ruminococcus sp.]|nr:hypothetical protein [Ruminococcus sp.]